jgi:hypothetical protein
LRRSPETSRLQAIRALNLILAVAIASASAAELSDFDVGPVPDPLDPVSRWHKSCTEVSEIDMDVVFLKPAVVDKSRYMELAVNHTRAMRGLIQRNEVKNHDPILDEIHDRRELSGPPNRMRC